MEMENVMTDVDKDVEEEAKIKEIKTENLTQVVLRVTKAGNRLKVRAREIIEEDG